MTVTLIALTLVLAFANGANDVSKGIAPLVGAGAMSVRRALAWGTAWTMAGAVAGSFFTQALVETFSGKGLLASAKATPSFLLAVACGAVCWLLIATRTGMPVSTTHALVGALCGAGVASAGVNGVSWKAVAMKTALPLAVSPFMSLAIVLLFDVILRLAAPGSQDVRQHTFANGFFSAAICFCRGLNDTPKIVALGAGAAVTFGVPSLSFYGVIAVAMGLGSLAWGVRVTETLARKVTLLSGTMGLVANAVTSALVAAASFYALPVSTTHVSSGSIVGAGLARRSVHWKIVGEMLLAWIVTLPAAALLGGIVVRFLS